MTGSRSGQLEHQLLGLRTPLSRVELAATQLARTPLTPAGSSLAQDISNAVLQLDQRIGALLGMLTQSEVATHPRADCPGLLETLRERMQPVLRARAVEWAEAAQPPIEKCVGSLAESSGAALLMFCAGTELAGAGGRMWLHLVTDEHDQLGIALRTERAWGLPALSARDTERIVAQARDLTSHRTGRLEIRDDSSGPAATLWVRTGEEQACAG